MQKVAQSKSYIVQNKVPLFIMLIVMVWLFDVFQVGSIKPIKREAKQTHALKENTRITLIQTVTLPAVPVSAKSQNIAPVLTVEADPIDPARKRKPSSDANNPTESSVTIKQTQVERSKALKLAKMRKSETIQYSEPNPDKVKGVISEMSAMDSRHIRFVLPRTKAAKERFLKHMYQCENMQFGAVSVHQPYKLSVLSKNTGREFVPSQLLRVAHDYLSNQERSLLQVYAKDSQPVRIFPVELDYKLAQHIARILNGKTLQQFSAKYFVRGENVGLSDISVNKQAIADLWMLSSGSCLSGKLS